MSGESSTAGTSDIDREQERARLARMGKVSMLGAFPFTVMLCIAGSLAARNLFPETAGFGRDLTIGGLAAIFAIPFALAVYRLSLEQNLKISWLGEANAEEMVRQARRRELETSPAPDSTMCAFGFRTLTPRLRNSRPPASSLATSRWSSTTASSCSSTVRATWSSNSPNASTEFLSEPHVLRLMMAAGERSIALHIPRKCRGGLGSEVGSGVQLELKVALDDVPAQ
jgi:hypothetical protein